MNKVSFCDKCSVKKTKKCAKNTYANLIFDDFDTLEHPKITSDNRCDLLLIKDNELNFIEEKASDRFIIKESTNNLSKKEQKKIEKKFDSDNARLKIENSKNFFLEKYPEFSHNIIKYYFIFSDTLIDHYKELPNTCVNIPLIKSLILSKIFSPFIHNPILHNGKPIPFIVDPCCNVSKHFPEA